MKEPKNCKEGNQHFIFKGSNNEIPKTCIILSQQQFTTGNTKCLELIPKEKDETRRYELYPTTHDENTATVIQRKERSL